jgi:hypothetical protein
MRKSSADEVVGGPEGELDLTNFRWWQWRGLFPLSHRHHWLGRHINKSGSESELGEIAVTSAGGQG